MECTADERYISGVIVIADGMHENVLDDFERYSAEFALHERHMLTAALCHASSSP